MGIFNKLLGKGQASNTSGASEEDELQPSPSQPIQGPPEFVRAVEIQRTYWTYNTDEQSHLESRGFEQLSWRERLRLHHLLSLHRLKNRVGEVTSKFAQSTRQLAASGSPFQPRQAMIWQGEQSQPGTNREPDLQGEFLNPSLTHLGCLEIYRLDANHQPKSLDFVAFDDLSGVLFGPPNLIRMAKLFYCDGRDEIVFVPLLYGLTWTLGNEYDRDGRMTRFIAHLGPVEIGPLSASGIGVGQQDFAIRSNEEGRGSSLFGIGSVSEISFPLDMADPRFDEKARYRGIEPDDVRRKLGSSSAH